MKVSKLVLWIGICFAFCNVVWAMDPLLDQSNVGKSLYSMEQEYLEVVAESEKDSTKPLYYFISQKPMHSWPSLISQSFKKTKPKDTTDDKPRVTAADLLFAIKHSISSAKDDKHKSLFELAIIERLLHQNADNRNAMTLLLTEASIKREPGWGWSADKFASQMTVLVACLEDGHIDALKAILNAWPKGAMNPLALNAITTTTQVPDPNPNNQGYFFSSYIPEAKSYNLIQWLLRFEACHMMGRYVKPTYLEVAGILLDFMKSRGYGDTNLSVFTPYLESVDQKAPEAKKEPTPEPIISDQKVPENPQEPAAEPKQEAPLLEDDSSLEQEKIGLLDVLLDNMANLTLW